MDDFKELLMNTFKEEANDLLNKIITILTEIEEKGTKTPLDSLNEIYRSAHSLKGAARSVEFMDIEKAALQMENIFVVWKKDEKAPATINPELSKWIREGVALILKKLESMEQMENISLEEWQTQQP